VEELNAIKCEVVLKFKMQEMPCYRGAKRNGFPFRVQEMGHLSSPGIMMKEPLDSSQNHRGYSYW
jgi:hypothetical protein